jgi:ribonuclease T2
MLSHPARLAALTAALVASLVSPGLSQEPGDFDFYVLALSWSPSYCLAEGPAANRQQCGRDADFGFIVHGLWPQFETGYPEYCQSSEPERVDGALGANYFDIMPSMGLIGHQWRKHGTCSGLDHEAYFDLVREAHDAVRIPDRLVDAEQTETVTQDAVEAAFVAANPGLDRQGIAVTCDRDHLREVRICLTKDLGFRSCPEVDADACPRATMTLPASD